MPVRFNPSIFVTPAKAGTRSQLRARGRADWVPAFAGMTRPERGGKSDAFRHKVTHFAAKFTLSTAKVTVSGPKASTSPWTLSEVSTPCR